MSADDYCRNKVALPGSSLYYSVLFAAPDLREALVALHALAEELREAEEGRGDDGIAGMKLAWWADELHRTGAGEPRHPVTRALAAPLAASGIDPSRFAGVLQAAGEHARREGYLSPEALQEHHECMADITGCMAAQICGCRDPRTIAISRGLGAGLALMDCARTPQLQLARGVTDATPKALADRARALLAGYLRDMPREDRVAQRSRRALAEMGLAQLDALERADFAAREPPVTITPLRKLWIAWKHRRG